MEKKQKEGLKPFISLVLSTIVDSDKIIFIEEGKLTGQGTHQELVETHELYRKFAEQQLT
ncbi:hypothetical protein [Oceanobacillus sp. CF4.6]|uniref:hypothetical protein n=1 Tax=Oceanobacillus sp. CF4.6 TaxID=3373080 RepID=UPI003EE47DB3